MLWRGSKWVALAVVVGVLAVLGAGSAGARDLSVSLGDAEARAVDAEGEIATAEAQVHKAEAHYAVASRQSDPAQEAAHAAQAELADLHADLLSRQRQARAHVNQLEAAHQKEVEDHDDDLESGIGIGLAMLIAAGIGLAWGWFRASAAVAALSRIDLGRAVALCVGAGFLGIALGGSIASVGGFLGVVGTLIFLLGFVGPIALLLGRHSAEVQRGRSKPIFKRERLPRWVSTGAAAVLFVFFLAAFGSALFAGEVESEPVSGQLHSEAMAITSGPGAEDLAAARTEAAKLQQLASGPLAKQGLARSALRSARRQLGDAEGRLVKAEADQRDFSRRLAVLAEREEREAAKAALVAEREADELAEDEAEQAAEECNPNYSGCLNPSSPDYDCEGGSGDGPDYTGTVEVIGYDEYELDDDSDGIGCDP